MIRITIDFMSNIIESTHFMLTIIQFHQKKITENTEKWKLNFIESVCELTLNEIIATVAWQAITVNAKMQLQAKFRKIMSVNDPL